MKFVAPRQCLLKPDVVKTIRRALRPDRGLFFRCFIPRTPRNAQQFSCRAANSFAMRGGLRQEVFTLFPSFNLIEKLLLRSEMVAELYSS